MLPREIDPDYTTHLTHLMASGGIGRNRAELQIRPVCIDEMMNAAKYFDMLMENLVTEQLDQVLGPCKWAFQDDGASPHRARVIKEWSSSWCLNVSSREFNWPDSSLGLNTVNPHGQL
jgi:hypothetical protein